ncbi:hypothetical protein [Streptomyces subrutilus]|uniref:Uncharacterized protein n=1 Tax=Streptomyces subrutilus TaxID=36818 RepID=A0A1E5PU17_9ACTN|nr:hypothetical protein [Streptomyces subrutilus]OEJ33094.1 hypothetical protein BGK67_18795 [Streptomyces subrutilus]
MTIPYDLEMEVVGRIYKEAEEAGWHHLPGTERTPIYHRWADDPNIGERLSLFIKTSAARRLWFKDGPMKEYQRALSGAGKYASLVAVPATDVGTLVLRALGPGWEPDLDTQRVKPMRVLVRNGEESTWFTWGGAHALRHLVYAALRAQANGDATPWALCVVTSFVKPLPPEEREEHLRIGRRCNLTIKHVSGE